MIFPLALVLTYSILGGPTQLPAPESDVIIERAMGVWAEAGRFEVRRVGVDEKADIRILWVFGDHPPCTVPFSFWRTGTLGHSYLPPVSESHMNRGEWWDEERVFAVAVHEIGHTLGLDHTDDPESVMYGYYVGNVKPTCGDRAVVRYLINRRVSP
jgi:hypothetical protein